MTKTPPAPETTTLDPNDVLRAYTIGLFPMADPATGRIKWYAPAPRTIIDLDRCVPPRSLRRTIRKGTFEVCWNTAFRDVIAGCAAREETWISPGIARAYAALHDAGWAHSVETWTGGRLAGGLYGVAIGGAFFGESMFSRESDASKVALMALAERMRERGCMLLDAQFMTEHLLRFGAHEVSRERYQRLLQEAIALRCTLYP